MEPKYPADEDLNRIAAWPMGDYHALMAFVRELWEFKEFGWTQDGDIYILATGGWSGNESLIGALQENFLFWTFHWESSTRGGRHTFFPLTVENLARMAEREKE